MQITGQRGAFPIVLDRPRTLFFAMGATALLVERYGMHFAGELYTVRQLPPLPGGDGQPRTEIKLKSVHALAFFLYAGLQEELAGTGESFTLEQVQGFIRPFKVTEYFYAVVAALTGAMATPAQPGKADAASRTPKPAAKKQAAKAAKKTSRKVSTLKVRSGLRLAR